MEGTAYTKVWGWGESEGVSEGQRDWNGGGGVVGDEVGRVSGPDDAGLSAARKFRREALQTLYGGATS